MANRSRPSTGRVNWSGRVMQRSLTDATTAGSSFRGVSTSSLIQNTNYTIACGIEFSNWTRFDLTQPCCTITRGHISTPPVSIAPGNKEVMISHKFGYSMTGSSGIASWKINNNDTRVVVLWSAPFFTFNTNTLAVGLTERNLEHNNTWFDMIYDRKNTRGTLRYKIGEYDKRCDEIMMENEDFQVVGSMGSSSKPNIKIKLRPQNTEGLFMNFS